MKTVLGHTSLRNRQLNTTRDEIVTAAMSQLRDAGTLSHESIAAATGMSARTVYRHFPTQGDLIAATWEQLKAVTKTRFPASEAEIVPLAAEIFHNFDENESLVRAFLNSGAGSNVRDQGAEEGRPAFQAALRNATAHLSSARRKRVVAVFLALYSAPAWRLMRDRGQLQPEEAALAVQWALNSLLETLKQQKKA